MSHERNLHVFILHWVCVYVPIVNRIILVCFLPVNDLVRLQPTDLVNLVQIISTVGLIMQFGRNGYNFSLKCSKNN